jgi:hypothetical protein
MLIDHSVGRISFFCILQIDSKLFAWRSYREGSVAGYPLAGSTFAPLSINYLDARLPGHTVPTTWIDLRLGSTAPWLHLDRSVCNITHGNHFSAIFMCCCSMCCFDNIGGCNGAVSSSSIGLSSKHGSTPLLGSSMLHVNNDTYHMMLWVIVLLGVDTSSSCQ